MGLEASLKLLDLNPDATIDDANQAYSDLHRKIDLFHKGAGAAGRGDRQEDMELLTCAYEKAVAYLSGQDLGNAPSTGISTPRSSDTDASESTNLHFTINVKAETPEQMSTDGGPPLLDVDDRSIEEAISITTRRMHHTESVLPSAQRAVESATEAVESAIHRHQSAKEASIIAIVAAKSAKSRSLLLEVESKRAMADAIAVAEKARDRVAIAREVAREAKDEAGRAREQASRVKKSAEKAAAEVACAEGLLEKEKKRLKALTHTLLVARNQMAMFQEATAGIELHDHEAEIHSSAVLSDDRQLPSRTGDGDEAARRRILTDLLAIEASLNARKRGSIRVGDGRGIRSNIQGPVVERRGHHRLAYPIDRRPLFSMGGQSIPVRDLSTTGMCLGPVTDMACPRIVRGAVTLTGRRPVNITGKVVRADEHGLGLKLVTRIGKHILDRERLGLEKLFTKPSETRLFKGSSTLTDS